MAMRKVVSRQEEAVRIKMACQDMNVYYDYYKDSWQTQYFNGDDTSNSNKGYLTSKFEPIATEPEEENYYIISFNDNEGHTLVNIESKDGRVLIEGLKLPLKEE